MGTNVDLGNAALQTKIRVEQLKATQNTWIGPELIARLAGDDRDLLRSDRARFDGPFWRPDRQAPSDMGEKFLDHSVKLHCRITSHACPLG